MRIAWNRRSGDVRWLEITDDLAARVWRNVRRGGPDECWPWTASLRPAGYGQIRVGGREGTVIEASRVVYAITHGELGPALHVLHSCDNPPCCNPSHLRTGTPKDNMRDMVERGRMRRPVLLRVERVCPVCRTTFFCEPSGRKLCSNDCVPGWHRLRGAAAKRDAGGRFAGHT